MHWVYFWIERTDDLFIFPILFKSKSTKTNRISRILNQISQDQQQLLKQDFPPKFLKMPPAKVYFILP